MDSATIGILNNYCIGINTWVSLLSIAPLIYSPINYFDINATNESYVRWFKMYKNYQFVYGGDMFTTLRLETVNKTLNI